MKIPKKLPVSDKQSSGMLPKKAIATGRPTLALAMMVKNEEAHLARCLDFVKGLVDEIVIVDTGSTDRTKEVAGWRAQKALEEISEARMQWS